MAGHDRPTPSARHVKPWLLAGLIALAPAPSMGEMIIQLVGGQRIVVPVDADQIERIEFTRGGDEAQSGTPTAAEAPVSTAPSPPARGRTWRVGAQRELKYPSDAARLAGDGDTVLIDAGTYHDDYATWRQSNLTLRGVGGMAHLKSNGLIPNRKAIWIIDGDEVAIENIEFSGAAVADTNGAGIRHQGGALSLRNTFFHDNEFSILSGHLPDAVVHIEASRFWFQRRPSRHSHGIYIGQVRRLTLKGNHFKGTDQGHQVKSRALENHILYNRIEDVSGGNSSRLIDLSNCGLSFIVGNDLHQAATSQNRNAIGYGPEGCERRDAQQMRLYVVNNTFINEATGGSLVNNFAGGDVLVSNNLVFGDGEVLVGGGQVSGNIRLPLAGGGHDWTAPPGSAAIDAAVDHPPAEGGSLLPIREFTSPAGTRERPRVGPLDVGSREYTHLGSD